jgi:ketosteroid isomerase-like protein
MTRFFRIPPAALAACTLMLTAAGCGQDLATQDPNDAAAIEQQIKSVDAQAETLKVNQAFAAATSIPDTQQSVEASLALFTDDMQHIGVFGRVRGKDQLRAVLNVALSAPGRSVTITANQGWAIDRNHLVGIVHFDNSFIGPDGQLVTYHLRALRAMVRQKDGSYLIASEHTSAGAPLPPPPSSGSIAPAPLRTGTAPSVSELTALMLAWQGNFNARNLDALLAGYTPDLKFVYAFEGEEGAGQDALRADVSGTWAASPTLQVQLQQYDVVALGDDAAMGLGQWVDSFTAPDGTQVSIQTQSSEIFIRTSMGWKVQAEAASFAPPAP